jgi:hypothetical protein
MWAGVALYAGEDGGSGAPFWAVAGIWERPQKQASSSGMLKFAIGSVLKVIGFLTCWTFDMNLFKKEEQRIPVEVMS